MSCFRVVSALCVLLFLTLLASACALGALPTTVEAQADWLADRYAVALELSYEGLSAESIQVSRAELANGLRSVIAAPLTRQQLREVGQWIVTDAVSPGGPTPPDLELHCWAGLTLEAIRSYLSRPPLTFALHRGIMAQAGIVFDALRRELAAQFSGVISDAESKTTGVVFGDTFLVSAAATSPVSPQMKRLFTPGEMDMLVEKARDMAASARRDWDESVARAAEEERAAWAASLEARSVYLTGAAARTQYLILGTSYTPPAILTKAEQQAVMDAYAAQEAAEAAPETGGQ
jgi:hypothetical protein